MMRFISMGFVISVSAAILFLNSCKHDPVVPAGQDVGDDDENDEVETCDTRNVTFADAVKPILQGNCVGCHSGEIPAGGLNFSTHAGIRPVALNGTLLGAISHDGGFVPMPQGGKKLTDCEIEIFETWIEDGAPNN